MGDLIEKKTRGGIRWEGGKLHPERCDWHTQQSSNRHRPGVLQIPDKEKAPSRFITDLVPPPISSVNAYVFKSSNTNGVWLISIT